VLVRSASQRLRDLCLAKAFLFTSQQLEDVEPLVEGRSAISIEIFGVGHCLARQAAYPAGQPPAMSVDSLNPL